MIRKVAPFFLLILGLSIFFYPAIKERWDDYRQQRILDQWEDNMHAIEDVSADPQAEAEDAKSGTPVAAGKSPADAGNSPAEAPATGQEAIDNKLRAGGINKKMIEGVLLIDKISLKLPIITDATQAHLAVSVASILHTGKPGQIGNYAIAGHRSHTFGRNFNRLDELEAGDRIRVQTADETFTYVVTSKQYVKPTRVDVLLGNGSDREITLITCHPLYHPTQRIVVKGVLASDPPND